MLRGHGGSSGPICCSHRNAKFSASVIHAPVQRFPCSALHLRAPGHLLLGSPVHTGLSIQTSTSIYTNRSVPSRSKEGIIPSTQNSVDHT